MKELLQSSNMGIMLALRVGERRGISKQLYNQIKDHILTGRLEPGTKLPPSRSISKDLAIARNTVTEALSQLATEGFLEGRVGAGTFVSSALPASIRRTVGSSAASAIERPLSALNRRPSAPMPTRRHRAFMPGLPAIDEFPFDVWARCAASAQRAGAHRLFGLSEPAGDLRLREAIAGYLKMARAVDCEADQVFVLAGAQDGIDLVCRSVLKIGDHVVVEEPGYTGLKHVLASCGAVLRPQPVDSEGLTPPHGRSDWRSVRLVCVTPSHQFPLGITMSASRRLDVLRAACEAGAWILEDDYDSEYRHSGHPIPSMHSIDRSDRVLHIGSFSKTLFPGLRLGYLVAPKALLRKAILSIIFGR